MPVKKFFIGPPSEGQITRNKPWMLPETAMASLRNAYTWRGSWKKRFGAAPMNQNKALLDQPLFTRLRINIGTPGASPANLDVPDASGLVGQLTLGQMFSVGSAYLTVVVLGVDKIMLTTSGSVSATINSTTTPNTITVTGATGVPVYYYPSTPVMHFGIHNKEDVNFEDTFAFDRQFAYTYTFAGGWVRSAGFTTVATEAQWTGTNSDFFYTTNYRGAAAEDFILFVTNNTVTDAMRYYERSTSKWNAFGSATTTKIDTAAAPDFLKTAKIIEPFKNRLVFFNVNIATVAGTVETRISNQILWTALGSPLAANAFNLDIVGGAGFLELPLKEAITAVEFIKDRCIVWAESSVYELKDTGNKNQPFILQQLDSELGVESTRSIIPFDKADLGFGKNGINVCDGLNVTRIDGKIPSTIFDVSNSNAGLERVSGIRDYFNELAYWSYPSISRETGFNEVFPNRVLVYNYAEDTWAFNDDSITALGYYQQNQDLTWDDVEATWDELNFPWNSPTTQAKYRSILGGNQEGWTFIIDAGYNTNSMSLQITNLSVADNIATITVMNHNLAEGSYVKIQSVQDADSDIQTTLNSLIFKVDTTADVNTFTVVMGSIFSSTPTTSYKGGGICTLVTPIEMITKQFNFFYESASNMAINQIDFFVDKSSNNQEDGSGNVVNGGGQVTVTYFVSSSTVDMGARAIADGGMLGTSILETTPYTLVPMEADQARFWHSLYPNFFGESIQLKFYLTDAQIRTGNLTTPTPYIAEQDFQLNAIIFHAEGINPFGS